MIRCLLFVILHRFGFRRCHHCGGLMPPTYQATEFLAGPNQGTYHRGCAANLIVGESSHA